MPGAAWRPINVPARLAKRAKGRAVILHVAASEATSLFGFFNGNASANSHFYVAKDGTIEQYVDTDYESWASMTANKNTISVESQGGVTDPNGEPWTAAQVAALGRICAWAHADEGIPLTLMPNSLPASKGIGYHRLGIDPWRVPGGEVWSSSRGKVCPGTAKIAQVPAVIAAANGQSTPTPGDPEMRLIKTPDGTIWKVTDTEVVAEGNINLANALAKTWGSPVAVETAEKDIMLADASARLQRQLGSQQDYLLGARPTAKPYLWDRVVGLGDELGKVQAPEVDEAKLAAALLADPQNVDALGAAIASHLKLSSD